jgi:ADP-glucose pyrophosphorylase
MVPFAGCHRVVDFTLRNAFYGGASNLVIYSSDYDDLEVYVEEHPLVKGGSVETSVKAVLSDSIDVTLLNDSLKEVKSDYFILYCGDNPGLIDFDSLFKKYKSKKISTVLFKLQEGDSSTLAYTILITTREYLLSVLETAIKEKRHSPNIFEMVNNMLINKGVETSTFEALYWPLKTVPDYYDYNMEIFKNRDLFNLIYEDSLLQSGIKRENSTQIGQYAKVTRSYIPDGCILNGVIDNSIIFPGVVVAENAKIRNSIILPYVGVGSGAVVQKAVLDEFTDYSQSDVLFNIGEKVRIGSEEEQMKNNDFPKALYNSISLVGRNSIIPENIRIGGACYVASATGVSEFEKNRYLDDGLSIVPYGDTIR